MPTIHPTAIVDPKAQLADDVVVGPYTLIGPNVRIGKGTRLGAHCIVENHTTIGEHNVIGHHVILGALPQDLKFRGEPATLIIGDHNDIRENVTAHIGTENGGGSTSIGSRNLLMVGAHVAHDCHIRSNTILANNVMLAGHIEIQDHAIVSGGAAITHYTTVGRYAFIGGTAGVVKDCPPFMISDGNHAYVRGVNVIGLTRHRFEKDTIDRLKRAYSALFGRRSRTSGAGGGLFQTIDQLRAEHNGDPVLRELLDFIHASAQAPHGRAAELARRDDKRAASPK
jgi:UDP-N-acetylglucosamine acyltransferase